MQPTVVPEAVGLLHAVGVIKTLLSVLFLFIHKKEGLKGEEAIHAWSNEVEEKTLNTRVGSAQGWLRSFESETYTSTRRHPI